MMLSLRAATIASVMAVVASTSVMAQTTGTIPPPAPSSQPPSPPPTANQYSSNEIIDAGHHFFGSVSHGLAMVVEKAVSKVLKSGLRTADIHTEGTRKVGTREMGEAVLAAL